MTMTNWLDAASTCLGIYGPQGCGKTTHAEQLRIAFGKDHVYDEWTFDDDGMQAPKPNSLILTQDIHDVMWLPQRLRYDTAIRLASQHSTQFQPAVAPWMLATFGREISNDKIERNHRFLEEALELVQALGCTADEAHQIVDYVYGRPLGDPPQEVGGVMVTLAALCLASDIDMHQAADDELARCWQNVAKIRAKQARKPNYSPLPGPAADEREEYSNPTQAGEPPEWWSFFITELSELPDRTSPENNPDALIATHDEMLSCALLAIERQNAQ